MRYRHKLRAAQNALSHVEVAFVCLERWSDLRMVAVAHSFTDASQV
jgi:hypothetical protein